MFAILHTDGNLKLKDLYTECRDQKWIPILTYENKVVCFHFQDVAKRFAKRNLPKDWLTGAIQLDRDAIKKIRDSGLKIDILDYPKKLNVKFELEVIEFNYKPEIRIG